MDPVADALIRIKNGYMVSRVKVSLRYSKLVLNLCKILKKEGYIDGCKVSEREIEVTLKYDGRDRALTDVKRISKPGLRVYKSVKSLPFVLNGLGIAIVSTPKGLMNDKEARKLGVGGEVMAEVW